MRFYLICLLALSGCPAAAPQPAADAGPQVVEGNDMTVVVFEREHVYFGAENRRSVDIEVTFPPADQTYSEIMGHFGLRCPDNRCDHWDRYATFGIVQNAGTDEEQYLELDRFITPYRVGFSWRSDLTDLRPLLTGTQTMRVFIDTWVGPGHAQGDGWLFNAEFDFLGGPPPVPEPYAVVPLWPHLSWKAGLPDRPVESQVPPQDIAVEAASKVVLRSFISGHGWNNRQNCAEFCTKEHRFAIAERQWERQVWREDCGQTETLGQQLGTWTLSRAGWCPGAQVFPWDIDITEAWTGSEITLAYALEEFNWAGDGDEPYYYLSGNLILYR
jgi:hypothetical protein